jgi:hypothetical protein
LFSVWNLQDVFVVNVSTEREGEAMELPYPEEIEVLMRQLYESLSEKDRRRYAAIEALKLGHGGRQYIIHILGCDYKTLQRGEADLHDADALAYPRTRQPGGGAKKKWSTIQNCTPSF